MAKKQQPIKARDARLEAAIRIAPETERGIQQYLDSERSIERELDNFMAYGYGIGIRQTQQGLQTCVRIYVPSKRMLDELGKKAQIPRHFDGLRTDVVEVGEIFRLAGNPTSSRKKPARPRKDNAPEPSGERPKRPANPMGEPRPPIVEDGGGPRPPISGGGGGPRTWAGTYSGGGPRGSIGNGGGVRGGIGNGGGVRSSICGPRRNNSGAFSASSFDRLAAFTQSGELSTAEIKDLCARRSVMNPLLAGVSIGPDANGPNGEELFPWCGTLGYFVQREDVGGEYVLSNNHVMADWSIDDTGAERRIVPVGTQISQPGVIDDPNPQSIGWLYDAVPISLNDQNRPNYADVSLALLEGQDNREAAIYGLGAVSGVLPFNEVQPYQAVLKAGRTTGLTLGLIADLDVNIWVNWGQDNYAYFKNQLGIMGTAAQPEFSAGGDSGSLVVDYAGLRAVGLLFAGSDGGLTFVNPIERVLSAFGDGRQLTLV